MGSEADFCGTLKLIQGIQEDLIEYGPDLIYGLVGPCEECRREAEDLLLMAGWTRLEFFDAFKAAHA